MSTATAPVQTQGSAPGSKPIMTHRQILLVIYGLMAGMFPLLARPDDRRHGDPHHR
ncbi:hypothetical protein [Humibacter ginsenosidimutans]|uniref:hypothetical protein n=1 Tax=Humibacter ginsenosidimutans TaxID=2599293 RepID=UPI00349E8B2C